MVEKESEIFSDSTIFRMSLRAIFIVVSERKVCYFLSLLCLQKLMHNSMGWEFQHCSKGVLRWGVFLNLSDDRRWELSRYNRMDVRLLGTLHFAWWAFTTRVIGEVFVYILSLDYLVLEDTVQGMKLRFYFNFEGKWIQKKSSKFFQEGGVPCWITVEEEVP